MFRPIHAITVVVGISFLTACSKSSGDNTNSNTQPKDTLGTGWSMVTVNTQQFTNVRFVQNNGIAVSTTGIYGSNDGGINWTQRSSNGNQAFGIGYAWRRNIGMDGLGNVMIPQGYANGGGIHSLTQSHDYNNFTTRTDSFNINDSWFLSNHIGYAISSNDQDTNIHFLKTIDDGTSWSTVSIVPRMPLITNMGMTRLAFVDSQTGWVTTPYGVFKTTNAGSSWAFQYAPPGIITNICVIDASTCYIEYMAFQGALDICMIGKTTDGGSNWQQIFSENNGPDVEAFWFVDAATGYMAQGKSIYKSTDGGLHWDKVVTINSSDCYFTDIYFTDAAHGWACSNNGQILHYLK